MPKPLPIPPEKPTPKESIEQKLDRIAEHLRRLDRRDKMRTTWMTIRGIIGLLPLIAIIGGAWYLYTHGDVLMQNFIEDIVKKTGLPNTGNTQHLLEQIQKLL